MSDFVLEKVQSFLQHPFALPLASMIVVFIVLVPVTIYRRREHRQWMLDNPPPPPPREIATMREDVKLTGGGGFCLVMLILTVFYAGSRFMLATNIVEITNAGLGLIGGTLLWGLGVALGRRRTFTVFNVPAPADRAE